MPMKLVSKARITCPTCTREVEGLALPVVRCGRFRLRVLPGQRCGHCLGPLDAGSAFEGLTGAWTGSVSAPLLLRCLVAPARAGVHPAGRNQPPDQQAGFARRLPPREIRTLHHAAANERSA